MTSAVEHLTSLPELTLGAWLRFDAIHEALEQIRPQTVLEIGAGEGALGAWLARRYDYTGIEPDAAARGRAQERLQQLGRGTMLPGPIAAIGAGTFDLICAFEVLEHIEDDARALCEWREHLRPGGWLLVSVPAHSKRFAASDVAVGHHRRYDREPLLGLLESSGLRVEWLRSWGFPLGVVLEAIRNQLGARTSSLPSTVEARTARSGRWLQPKGRAAALTNAALARPFRWLQRPFEATERGIGWVALARLQSPG